MSGQPVPAGQVRRGDLLSYQGCELVVTGTYGTWYREDGQPVAGLAIECRSGSAWWIRTGAPMSCSAACGNAAAPLEWPGPGM